MRIHRYGFLWMVVVAVALLIPGCGGGSSGGSGETAQAAAEPSGPSPREQGEEVAQQILAAFDEVVAETTQLINEDPNADTLMPKLEELFTRAESRMTELNASYLALRDADVEAFGAANSYLGEHRGRHVHSKDTAFAPFLLDYPGEDPDGHVKELLSGSAYPQLIDLATKKS